MRKISFFVVVFVFIFTGFSSNTWSEGTGAVLGGDVSAPTVSSAPGASSPAQAVAVPAKVSPEPVIATTPGGSQTQATAPASRDSSGSAPPAVVQVDSKAQATTAATVAGHEVASSPVADLGDLSGTYDVHGIEAVSKESYQGVAMVLKTGEVYGIQYQDEEGAVLGVGIVDGGRLSIAYASEGIPAILVLKKMPDGSLNGPWAYQGENFTSSEIWTRR